MPCRGRFPVTGSGSDPALDCMQFDEVGDLGRITDSDDRRPIELVTEGACLYSEVAQPSLSCTITRDWLLLLHGCMAACLLLRVCTGRE